MKTMYIFDVDGTLCPSRRPMTEDFYFFFKGWSENKKYAIVSGSDLEKLKGQLPTLVLANAEFIACCSGNQVFKYDLVQGYVEVLKNPFMCSDSLIAYLEFEIKYATSSTRFGNHIEHRDCSINFSICGRNAPQDVRDSYEAWDRIDGERQRVCDIINTRFPEYECRIGGQISLDITMKGFNKSQVLYLIDLTRYSVEFYGDKIENGNDKPLADKILELGCGFSYNVSGPEQLMELLDR